jgi:flagellar basal body-associated protein FliL
MRRSIWILIIALVILLLAVGPAWAQCAMCKQTIENAANAKQAAQSLNLAILVLFIPPVAMFVGIFTLFYRFRNVQGKQYIANNESAEE